MATLRQYLKSSEIQSYVAFCNMALVDDRLISQAETIIDNYIANFYEPPFCRALPNLIEIKSGVFTNNSVTINTYPYNIAYTNIIITILSGDKVGTNIPITNTVNNVLNFGTVTGLAGTYDFKISQLGKMPFYNQNYILPEIKEALAYQIAFLVSKIDDETGQVIFDSNLKQSENIGENYSYSLAGDKNGGAIPTTNVDRLAPIAKDILDNMGISYQPWI
jgi:hypothetical protein